jgi:2-polyprenyl-3-methyl-5-hydroxy-6-metoxy-1,4-benzoquinol methylase
MIEKNMNFWNDELPMGYYDKIFSDGAKKNNGVRSLWHYITFLAVSNYLNQSGKHLDYACGPGTFIGNFSYSNSIGVDISQKQINFAKSKYIKNEYYVANDFDFSNHKDSFDLITVLGLYEFIDDNEIDDLMKKFNYCLKKNGKIIITTPNFSIFMEIMIKVLNLFKGVDYSEMYINKFNKKKISNFKKKYSDFYIENSKLLNFGVFFGFLSFNIGIKIHDFIDNIFSSYFGFLHILILDKK